MKQSTDRIITTHVGSLARPHSLLDTMREKEHGRRYDESALQREITEAVADRVRRQVDAGLDVVTDGEQGKVSFYSYVLERLDGYSATEGKSSLPASWYTEVNAFPEYYKEYLEKYSAAVSPPQVVACTGPVRYRGHDAVRKDIENLKAALDGVRYEEAFLPSTSPGGFGANEYYHSEQEYLYAVAEALREEYLAIIEAGLVLQVDDPWLIEKMCDPASSFEEQRRRAAEHVEVINHSLRGIPEEKVRFHTCYGLNHGPRLSDLPLRQVAEFMLRVNAGAYSFEVANPRHQHEWRIWEDLKLPDGKVLIPGFLGHANNYVEHPELIAEGVVNYANLVGRQNVIAGADCGFSSRATYHPEVHPTVVWPKFEALSEGAALATKRLWT